MDVIDASHCIFVVCSPMNEANYLSNKSKKENGLTKRFRWAVYEEQLIKPFLKTSTRINNEGVKIVSNCTWDVFKKLLVDASKKKLVIILFAHHEGLSIEFYDRLVDIDALIEAIPLEGEFILDLCVCTSEDIGERVRMCNNKNVSTKFITNNAIPFFWMYFYLTLFKILNTKNFDYNSAFIETKNKFLS